MGFFINVGKRPRLPEHVVIDGHAVGGHADREFIVCAVPVPAGCPDIFIDLPGGIGFPQVGQIHHPALFAPICHNTLRAFQNQVRSAVLQDGLADPFIPVVVGQIFHRNVDVRIFLMEAVQDVGHRGGVAPVAYRESP